MKHLELVVMMDSVDLDYGTYFLLHNLCIHNSYKTTKQNHNLLFEIVYWLLLVPVIISLGKNVFLGIAISD